LLGIEDCLYELRCFVEVGAYILRVDVHAALYVVAVGSRTDEERFVKETLVKPLFRQKVLE
jgi:hypothetical protein